MSLTLTEIKDTQLISTAPKLIWDNFTAIKNWVDKIENSINPETRKIQLIDGITVGDGGLGVRTIQVKLEGGVGFSVSDNTKVNFSVNASGAVVLTSFSVDSSSDTVSELQKVAIKKEASFEKSLISKGTLDLTDNASKVQHRQSRVQVLPVNIGASATQKIQLSTLGKRTFFDCFNNGSSLGSGDGTAKIALGVTDMLLGQEIEIIILRRNNTDVVSFINSKPTGTNDGGGNPILEPLFAHITVNGFDDIPMSSIFSVDNSTLGAKISAIWTNTGTTEETKLRLLVTEVKGFTLN